MAILQRKAYLEGNTLPDEVAEFIAQQVKSNIRELEGLLIRVIAYASLTAKPLSLALARETLKDILPEQGKKPNPNELIKAVARHYDLKISEIKSKSNSQQVVFPRKVAMFLLRRLAEISYPEIGKLFNDKHHSTVMYAVKDIEERRAKDPDLDRTLQTFEQQLR